MLSSPRATAFALSVYRRFATHGGLMAYGAETSDIFRRSAT